MRALLLSFGLLAVVLGLGARTYLERREMFAHVQALTGGDSQQGKTAARDLGCVACHEIPGVRGPQSHAGPPLAHYATRLYVAGVTENKPENLVHFIRDPRAVAPRSAMPKLPMTEANARDLAAYLYTLR
jgi:cytochrome c1